MYIRIIYSLLTTFYIFFIFYLSSLPDTSFRFADSRLEKIFWNMGHIPLYSILAVLLFLSFKPHRKPMFYLLIGSISIIIAVCDELNQSTTAGRTSSFLDICLDFLGIYIGILFIKFLYYENRVTTKI